MPNPTDPLTAYRLRSFQARQRKLAAREDELRRELDSIEDAQRATTAVIAALTGDESDSRPHVVYTDGGARPNPGEAAAAYVLYDPSGPVVAERAHRLGHRTSNQAEFEGAVLGLARAAAIGIQRLELRTDSTLVAGALNGTNRVRSRRLKALAERAVRLAARFDGFRAVHVPRSRNQRADALVSAALAAPRAEAA